MKRILVAVILVMGLAVVACGDTTFTQGEILTASKLNAALAEKVNKTGDSVTGKLTVPTLNLAGTDITATGAELNYVDGVTSAVQTQLDGKVVKVVTDGNVTNTFEASNSILGKGVGVQTNYAGIGGSNVSFYFDSTIFSSNVPSYTVAVTGTNSLLDIQGSFRTKNIQLNQLHSNPATSTTTCIAGEIRISTDFISVCTATNTWKRAALSTW